jgi:hypothetical protein
VKNNIPGSASKVFSDIPAIMVHFLPATPVIVGGTKLEHPLVVAISSSASLPMSVVPLSQKNVKWPTALCDSMSEPMLLR